MTSTEFIYKAKQAVVKDSGYLASDVQLVWFGYVLGNMKAILIILGDNVGMFEVTYNAYKNEIYVDQYYKYCNTRFKADEL